MSELVCSMLVAGAGRDARFVVDRIADRVRTDASARQQPAPATSDGRA